MTSVNKLFAALLAITAAACATDNEQRTSDVGGGKADHTDDWKIVEVFGSGFTSHVGATMRAALVGSAHGGPMSSDRARRPTLSALTAEVSPDGELWVARRYYESTSPAKLLVHIDVDGSPGCSAADFVASAMLSESGGDTILEISPTQLPLVEPMSQELADCNEVFAPRYAADVRLDGFTGITGHFLEVYALPHVGYSNVVSAGTVVGSGRARLTVPDAVAHGYAEKLIMFVDQDLQPGCSEDDVIAAVITDPIGGSLHFELSPTNLPRTSDPTQDLHDCNKLVGQPVGDHDLIVRGSGFDDREGRKVTIQSSHDYRVATEATIVDGRFEIVLRESLWQADPETMFVIVGDDDGDGRCGSPFSDALSVDLDTSYATADLAFDLTPATMRPCFGP
jgi:hypothetical protein